MEPIAKPRLSLDVGATVCTPGTFWVRRGVITNLKQNAVGTKLIEYCNRELNADIVFGKVPKYNRELNADIVFGKVPKYYRELNADIVFGKVPKYNPNKNDC
eukprot:2939397-Amphidinium_carterae.1